MSGMDFYEAIARELPALTTRIVFLSGGAFTERARAFLEKVPNPRVEKPFDGPEVVELVNVCLQVFD